jgi:hypothetical protein
MRYHNGGETWMKMLKNIYFFKIFFLFPKMEKFFSCSPIAFVHMYVHYVFKSEFKMLWLSKLTAAAECGIIYRQRIFAT